MIYVVTKDFNAFLKNNKSKHKDTSYSLMILEKGHLLNPIETYRHGGAKFKVIDTDECFDLFLSKQEIIDWLTPCIIEANKIWKELND